MSDGSTPPPSLAASGQPKIEFPPSRLVRLRAYQLLLTLAVIVFIADQLTKWWIVAHIPFDPNHGHHLGEYRTVIAGFFYIIHVGNPGAAWSMFSGQSKLLAGLAAATLLAIAWWRHAPRLRQRLPQLCFGLLVGGIAGYLLDRLRYGYVVDFIDLHFGTYT